MQPAENRVRASLSGRTVLLVEDESLVWVVGEDILLDAGACVLIAMRLGEACALAASRPVDVAVLDVNLGGGDTSFPVADILLGRNIPFLFATGYDAQALDPRFAGVPKLRKPYAPGDLVAMTERMARPR